MIRFYYHPTPNPAKVALFLEEAGLAYEVVPVDTKKGERNLNAFRQINPNGKVPAIVGVIPDDREVSVFDSSAILLYLAETTGKYMGAPTDRAALLSCLSFIRSGLGPFSGQAVHFQHAAPEKLTYAINRFCREAERDYAVLDERLVGRRYIVGETYTIVDMSAWGWIARASFVLPGSDDLLVAYPNLKRWFSKIDARPAAIRHARSVKITHSSRKWTKPRAARSFLPTTPPRNRRHPGAALDQRFSGMKAALAQAVRDHFAL